MVVVIGVRVKSASSKKVSLLRNRTQLNGDMQKLVSYKLLAFWFPNSIGAQLDECRLTFLCHTFKSTVPLNVLTLH